MCNYYCLYLRHPGSAQAVIKHLRENALKEGVQFVLYPKLYEFPEVFKRHNFGNQYPNFLGVLYFKGDAAFFPDDLILPGVIVEHLYSQDIAAEEYFNDKVGSIMRGYRRPSSSVVRGSVVKRSRLSDDPDSYCRVCYSNPYEAGYYRRMDYLQKEEREIERLLADHRERVDRWKKDNSIAIVQKRADRERMLSAMRAIASRNATFRYGAYKRTHPGYFPTSKNNVYGKMFEEEMVAVRNSREFKYPMDLIDAFFANKPRKSQELKDRIAKFRRLSEDFNTWDKPK